NGMLYGGAVGTGFAVFESMGYAMNIYMGSGFFGLFQFATDNAFDKMVNVIGLRAFLSPGGHIAWAAMEGAFLLIVLGGKEFKWSAIISPKYLTFLAIPVALHAVWDMPILNFSILFVPVKQTALSVIAWIIILVFLHRGLSEINEI
nr:PrsW family intramembrane metalloprotease [Lachnospiraceae bacterium]